jgi:LytS/YehU family sensor histidine kinase
MENYIDLMKLRCNDMTRIERHFDEPDDSVKIAPLLFISLLENAFKHGINARKESFVRVNLELAGDNISFTCENSYYPNSSDGNKIGSGIGLENLKRRLRLLYPDSYEYVQKIEEDTYKVNVTIKNNH